MSTTKRTRAGTWAHFERRFSPIVGEDGSLMREWADLPKPVPVHHLWTVVECDGRLYVSPGNHYVNRIGYVLTHHQWTEADKLRDWRYA